MSWEIFLAASDAHGNVREMRWSQEMIWGQPHIIISLCSSTTPVSKLRDLKNILIIKMIANSGTVIYKVAHIGVSGKQRYD